MDEYIYASSRFRVREGSLIGNERIQRLLEAGNLPRCVALLSEFGVELVRDPETGAFLREETLLRRLRRVYEEMLADCPDAAFLRLWLYPYDCNNLKALIKCRYRGVDASDLLFDFGTLDLGDLLYMAEKNDFSALGAPFAEAAGEACESLAKTGNPQWVDLILDRACYAAMLAEAKKSKVALAVRMVQVKIDLTNLLTCVRLLRMKAGEAGRGMLQDALLLGGNMDAETLLKLYDGGEAYLWERLAYSPYERFARAAGGEGATLTAIERAADNAFMEQVMQAKAVPYGPEPLMGFLLAAENESRNLRIILAGFEVGLSAQTVKERMRDAYV